MAEVFLALSVGNRREVLEVAASESGRPPHLLEKDVWVVWALAAMFESPLGEHLVFKGGTSLSKAYKAIRRFSEDIDLTYDIRALAPEMVGDAREALPATRSQEKRWTSQIRKLLPAWVSDSALPIITAQLEKSAFSAKARTEADKISIEYEPIAPGYGYIPPVVTLEFGARSTGEPCEIREIRCDAAECVKDVLFPTARPRVMRAERTFWEKATAVHVFCAQGRLRGEGFARHWHDLARLDETEFGAAALADRDIARSVASHKAMFFAEKGADGRPVDYRAAVEGGLRLVPAGEALKALAEDYDRMIKDGLFVDEAETL